MHHPSQKSRAHFGFRFIRILMRVVERASKYTHVTAALRDGPLYLSQTTIPSTRSRAQSMFSISTGALEPGLVQVHLSKWTCILRVHLAVLISP